MYIQVLILRFRRGLLYSHCQFCISKYLEYTLYTFIMADHTQKVGVIWYGIIHLLLYKN